jgi:hypothetical protein
MCDQTFRMNLSPSSSRSIISKARNQGVAGVCGSYPPAARWFLVRLIFDLKDGGDIFLWSVGSHPSYTALYKKMATFIPHLAAFPFPIYNKLRGLSPQANYTDWATATCRRNLVLTFADRGMSRGQRGGTPTVVNLSFLDRIRYSYFM